MLNVIYAKHGTPPSYDTPRRTGDIYICGTKVYIFQYSDWVLWEPTNALELTIDKEVFYTAPCPHQGIQLIDDIEEHDGCIHHTWQLLQLGLQDPLTSTHIATLLKMALWHGAATSEMTLHMSASNGQEVLDMAVPVANVAEKNPATSIVSCPAVCDIPTELHAGNKGKGTVVEKTQSTSRMHSRQGSDRMQVHTWNDKKQQAVGSDGASIVPCKTDSKDHRIQGITWHQDTKGSRNHTGNTKGKGKRKAQEDDATTKHAPCMEPGPSELKQSKGDDLQAVEYMSGAPRAQEYMYSHTRPMLVELKYQDDAKSIQGLVSRIQDALSLGSAILVHGWDPKPTLDFTVEDIQLYRPTMAQSVSVQDTALCAGEQTLGRKADLSKVHNTTTIEKFIWDADEEKVCMNLLDLPNPQPDVPIFLRELSDTINAKLMTMNDCYLPDTSKNCDKCYYGVQAILGDTERLQGWDLLMHGGFLTYPHHNAGSLCTYVTVRSGSKIWGYFDTPGSDIARWDDLFKAWDNIFQDNIALTFKKCNLGTILLEQDPIEESMDGPQSHVKGSHGTQSHPVRAFTGDAPKDGHPMRTFLIW
ncbi:hypothetical protein J3A83DRAFT_4197074 [Scleroderma citrinum]